MIVDLGSSSIRLHDHVEPGGVAYQHEHTMLDSENPLDPLHGHDEARYGPLSPVYGPKP